MVLTQFLQFKSSGADSEGGRGIQSNPLSTQNFIFMGGGGGGEGGGRGASGEVMDKFDKFGTII